MCLCNTNVYSAFLRTKYRCVYLLLLLPLRLQVHGQHLRGRGDARQQDARRLRRLLQAEESAFRLWATADLVQYCHLVQ